MNKRFFGLHIDLHATQEDTQLGKNVNEKLVETLIETGKPDFIQYDCKGHVGFLAYPESKVSVCAGDNGKNIQKDSIRIYRDVTRRYGVDLLMHFSGIWDMQAMKEHPEWAALDREGKPIEGFSSLWGDYCEKRMIPQMKEIIDKYDVDGFWVDGECWALQFDYCEEAKKIFTQRYGNVAIPSRPGEPLFKEWGDVHRDQFFVYLKKWMDAIHAYKPGIMLISNWLYTNFLMEDPRRLEVDQVSGDFDPVYSTYAAEFSARIMEMNRIPWDLMSWSAVWIHANDSTYPKGISQILQEAAVCLSHGGGYQLYLHPDRHGGIAEYFIRMFGEVSKFCHARKEYCFESDTIAQIGILADNTTHYHSSDTPGNCHAVNAMLNARGALEMFTSAGFSCDIIPEFAIAEKAPEYPVLIVPESDCMTRETIDAIKDKLAAGGRVIMIGVECCRRFLAEYGIKTSVVEVPPKSFIHCNGEYILIKKNRLEFSGEYQTLFRYAPCYVAEENELHDIVVEYALGGGVLICIGANLASEYALLRQHVAYQLAEQLAERIFVPLVKIEKNPHAELVLRRKNNKRYMNVINAIKLTTQNTHQSPGYYTCARNTPLCDIEISIHDDSVSAVTVHPENYRLPVIGGRLRLPKLEYHCVIEF